MTPVPFAPGAIMILPPAIDVPALAPGTLEGPIFPLKGMNVGLALFSVEQLVDV